MFALGRPSAATGTRPERALTARIRDRSSVPLAGQGANDANQVAFRVLEPRPLAPIRRSSNAVLCPCLGGVVLLELNAATPFMDNLLFGSRLDSRLHSGRDAPRPRVEGRPRLKSMDLGQVKSWRRHLHPLCRSTARRWLPIVAMSLGRMS